MLLVPPNSYGWRSGSGKMFLFISEQGGQASAMDLLLFALLTSFATLIVTSSGSSVHGANIAMEEIQSRYALDLAQSFALSSRYVTDSEDPYGVTYTLGPNSYCSSDSNGAIFRLSEVVDSISGTNPLERNLKGSLLDLMADDISLSLGSQTKNGHYSLSNSIFTGCFHEQVHLAVKKHFTFVSGGSFEFQIDAHWHPFIGTDLNELVYSNVSYGAEALPVDSPIYVTRFLLSVPITTEELSSLGLSFETYLNALGEIEELLPGNHESDYETLFASDNELRNLSEVVNSNAVITVKLWPKEAG